VDDKNRVDFLPTAVQIASRLGSVCQRIGATIRSEVEGLEKRLITSLPKYPTGTAIGSLVESLKQSTPLSTLPSEASLKTAAEWSSEHNDELDRINNAVLTGDPSLLAAQRARCQKACSSLALEIDSICESVGDNALSELQTKYRTWREAQEVVAIASSSLALEPLGQIGSEPWRKMFQYAKEYSRLVYPDVLPPAIRGGDRCVLCQQELSSQAADRLRRFEQFVTDRASQDAERARAEYAQSLLSIERLTIPSGESVDQRLAEYGGTSEERRRTQAFVVDYVVILARRRDAILDAARTKNLKQAETALLPPRPSLSEDAVALSQEACEFQKEAINPSDRSEMIARREELIARKQLSNEILAVLERRSDLERWLKLRRCQVATNTQGISFKVTEFRRSSFVVDLHRRINEEIDAMRLSHIPFKVRDISDRAESLVKITIDSAAEVSNSRVLSEGEQRALALAYFLADVAGMPANDGIIVDDPVSSLDHIRMRSVARRLVDEAARRQVIVFTHNLSFYRELADAAAERQVRLVNHRFKMTFLRGQA
jgi:hypothetical protein